MNTKICYKTISPGAVLLIVLVIAGAGVHGGGLDFIVPGVSLESVSFGKGAVVRYLMISETFGVRDSSLVELSVLDADGGRVTLEVASSPYPESAMEKTTVRLLVHESIKEISSPEDVDSCILRIYVKEGTEPLREPTRDEIDKFDLKRLFHVPHDEDVTRRLPPEEIDTPAGAFMCEVEELSRNVVRQVMLGGVEAERKEERRTTLWLSSDVPFWGLVRSRVEDRSSTKILGKTPLADPDTKITVTESFLVSFTHPK
jgi:hypothetical protein